VWLILVVVAPLGFNFCSRRVFEPEKAFALRLVAFLFVCRWVARIASAGFRRSVIYGISTWRQPRYKASIAAACVGVVTIAATLASVEPRISWTGSYEWRQGAFTSLACLVVFLAAAWQPQVREWQGLLLGAIELTSIMVAGYGILQYIGLDPLPWQPSAAGRAFSTLGHPNFLAAYLVLVIPVVGAHLLSAVSWPARLFRSTVLGANVLCLYLTFSRSGWLGLLTAVGFVAALQLIYSRRRSWWLVGIGCAFVILAASSLVAYLDPAGLVSRSPLEPVHSFLRGKSATAHVRALTWSGVWKLIADRPVLGFGPETFRLIFPRAFPPLLSIYGGAAAAGDHAHNELLDWALNTGLLGVAAYVSWFATVMWTGLRSLSDIADNAQRTLLIGLLAAMVGYTVQNQLSFVTIAPMSYFWMIAGWAVAISQSATTPADEIDADEMEPAAPGGMDVSCVARREKMARILCGIGLATVLLFAALRPNALALWADVHAQAAWNAARAGDGERSAVQYQQALELQPAQDRYWQSLAEVYATLALSNPHQAPEIFPPAERALRQAIALSPLDVNYRLALGELYYTWGLSGQPDRLVLALSEYQQAAEMSPSDPQIWCEWGRIHQAQDQLAAALDKYEKALALNPLHVQTYTYLGQTYLALQRVEEAREVFAKIDQVTAELDRMVAKR